MTAPEQLRDAWDRFAAGYDEAVTPFGMRIAEDALRRVDVRPGMRLSRRCSRWRCAQHPRGAARRAGTGRRLFSRYGRAPRCACT